MGSSLTTLKLNRYPDPLQWKVKEKIAAIKNTDIKNIFLGNGSDEAIDILIRAFCNPGKDNAIILPPTYGMYEVAAKINDIEIKAVNLLKTYQPDMAGIKSAIDKNTKLIFICSPNNPTGGTIDAKSIESLLKTFNGIVIVDEAYIDFADSPSMVNTISNYPNLVVLQTFSKAWGLAGLRMGMAFARPEIIDIMNKIKPPYNVGDLAQKLMLQALDNTGMVKTMVKSLKAERAKLLKELPAFSFIKSIVPSDANFLLVKTSNADKLYRFLIDNNVVVRNRSSLPLCEGGLRITVGTTEENLKLIALLKRFDKVYKA